MRLENGEYKKLSAHVRLVLARRGIQTDDRLVIIDDRRLNIGTRDLRSYIEVPPVEFSDECKSDNPFDYDKFINETYLTRDFAMSATYR